MTMMLILICAPSHLCVVYVQVSEQLVNMADLYDPHDHDAYSDLCHLLPACCQCPEGH